MAKKKKEKVEFPAVLFAMYDHGFEAGFLYAGENIDNSLETGVPTPVAIYELVGIETRTKKVVVEVDDK